MQTYFIYNITLGWLRGTCTVKVKGWVYGTFMELAGISLYIVHGVSKTCIVIVREK